MNISEYPKLVEFIKRIKNTLKLFIKGNKIIN
jgi:hypothetical protein